MSDRDGANLPEGESRSSQTGAVKSRRLRWLLGSVASALVVTLTVIGLVYVVNSQLDSDADGLTDHVETSGWQTLAGISYVTDPRVADTDGDGLSDGDEAGAAVSDSDGDTAYAGISDPTKVDSDDDGLDDAIETREWQSAEGDAFRTEPMVPDTDGDGLVDGDEAGEEVEVADELVKFALFSNPLMVDTDGDGLSDAAEADLSIDPFDRDSDGDALEDGREVEHFGTAPDAADTDGDGFDDGYEVENEESQGLDPLWADVKVEASTYARDFAQGAFLGELAPSESLAWLVGNLASGGSSFIPGVGWVVGGAADLRDAIGSTIRADWVGAGFSIVGMVPGGGDVAAIPAKTAKFVQRYPALTPAVGATIVALSWVPDQIKVAALKASSPNGWDSLRSAGASEKSIRQLATGKVSVGTLADAMKRDGHVPGASARFFNTGRDGEKFLEHLYNVSKSGSDNQVSLSTKTCVAVCNAFVRRFDVLVDNVAHEAKVGRVYLTASIERQIRSDAHLVEQGVIDGAHWHFLASSVSNSMGPSKPVLDLLEELGIPFTFHLPA